MELVLTLSKQHFLLNHHQRILFHIFSFYLFISLVLQIHPSVVQTLVSTCICIWEEPRLPPPNWSTIWPPVPLPPSGTCWSNRSSVTPPTLLPMPARSI